MSPWAGPVTPLALLAGALSIAGAPARPWTTAPATRGATVHLSIDGGPWSGDYSAPFAEPCFADQEGPGSWYVSGIGPSPLEFVEIRAVDQPDGDSAFVALSDTASGAYATLVSTRADFEVDDRGTSATLTGHAELSADDGSDPVNAALTVECDSVDGPGREATAPPTTISPTTISPTTISPTTINPTTTNPATPTTTSATAPPGSTTISVSVATGAHQGGYDLWSPDVECRRTYELWTVDVHRDADDQGRVDVLDPAATPMLVSVFAGADEATGDVVGQVAVGFRGDRGMETYVESAPTVAIDDQGATATISVDAPSASRWSLDGNEPDEAVALALVVRCAEVGP